MSLCPPVPPLSSLWEVGPAQRGRMESGREEVKRQGERGEGPCTLLSTWALSSRSVSPHPFASHWGSSLLWPFCSSAEVSFRPLAEQAALGNTPTYPFSPTICGSLGLPDGRRRSRTFSPSGKLGLPALIFVAVDVLAGLVRKNGVVPDMVCRIAVSRDADTLRRIDFERNLQA
jgi:hypothetical protein